MKGCLLLQREFLYIGHYLAEYLQNDKCVESFCALIYGRPGYEYLLKEKSVNYTSLLLSEDIHNEFKNEKLDKEFLKQLEADYGLPYLWPYLSVDRIIMYSQLVREYPYEKSAFNHYEMMLLLQVYAKKILKMFDEEKPDFILFSVVGSMDSTLLYHIAKKRGIKTLVLLPSSTGRCLYSISERFDRFTEVEKLCADKKNIDPLAIQEAKDFIQAYREKPIPFADYIEKILKDQKKSIYFKFLWPTNFFHSIASFGQSIIKYHQKKNKDFTDIKPSHFVIDRIKRKFRNLIGTSDLFDQFDPNDKFVFFPLHYEPEVSLLGQAPFFTDQIHLIKQIAKSLPLEFKLYVKEHPAMVEYRPRKYYKELKKIPNVKLINPLINSYQIIPSAKIVATITGSAGWESVLLKKPVISFGNQFYNFLGNVKHVTDLEQIPWTIKELLENFEYNESETTDFVAAIFQESVNLDLVHLWFYEMDIEKKKAGLEPLAKLLEDKISKLIPVQSDKI